MTLRVILPITKVDAAQRLVYGTFTEEQGDRSGEVMDYNSSKPYMEEWSDTMYKASGGKSYGNLRGMHKNIAAGLFSQPIDFNDVAKSANCCARVVDDDEWKKVEEGVYTGFSIGGQYIKRWVDPDNPLLTRYTAKINEVSLVDLPCVEGATFQFIKTDHAPPENILFKRAEAPEAEILELEDATGENLEDKTLGKTTATTSNSPVSEPPLNKDAVVVPVVEGEDNSPDDGVSQVWLAKDKTPFAKKAEARAHNRKLVTDAAVAAVTNPAQTALNKLTEMLTGEPPSSEPGSTASGSVTTGEEQTTTAVSWGYRMLKTAKDPDAVKKGMWDISRVASILCDMDWLCECFRAEAARENDGSTLPGDAQDIVNRLCELLRKLVMEETEELMVDLAGSGGSDPGGDQTVILIAAAGLRNDMRKALSGLEGLNVNLKKVLDKVTLDEENNPLQQTDPSLTKNLSGITADDLRPDNMSLPEPIRLLVSKGIGLEQNYVKLTGDLEGLAKQVKILMDQPMPAKGAKFVITKSQDSGTGTTDQTETPEATAAAFYTMIGKMAPKDRAMALMKLSLANPTLHIPGTE